jgi:hypothetical protein
MAKDYSQLTKEELLKIVEKLESRRTYGLVWDKCERGDWSDWQKIL